MTTNELKQTIEKLLNECPECKVRAACAADAYNCYNLYDYRHVVKDYCRTLVDFYEIVAEGNPDKIVKFINEEVEGCKNSFINRIRHVNDRY